MNAKRFTGALLAVAGAAGVTAGLASVSDGMRDVLRADGGFCASGGPYVVAHPCAAGDVRLLMAGIIGGFLAMALYAAGTGMLGRPASAGLLAWTALFGALGWNFISLGTHPGAAGSSSRGWLVTGGLFWLMALGGLIPFLTDLAGRIRDGGRHALASMTVQPLVRAAVLTGLPVPQPGGAWATAMPVPGGPTPGSQPDLAGRRTAWALAARWLAASVAGAVIGLAASSWLIAALR